MSWGWGFLKQMNDTLRDNRELLRKKKTPRERYKDGIANQRGSFEHQQLADVEERVRRSLQRNPVAEWTARIIQVGVLAGLAYGLFWLFTTFQFSRTIPPLDKTNLFRTVTIIQPDSSMLKVDYFPNGIKASETVHLDGKTAQTSTSYYESGEPFRYAVYFQDTLISETFLYKSGDTIRNFPSHPRDEIYHVTLHRQHTVIHFDLYAGKIIQATYKEEEAERAQ